MAGGACKAEKVTTTRGTLDSTSTTVPLLTLTGPAPTVVASPAAVTLESKLLKNVPAGYKQEADDVADTGPSDLEKAVRDDGSPDARDALTKAGFVAGYQRLWTKPEADIIVFLYQFNDPAGAASFNTRITTGLGDSGEGTTATPFAVNGVPGAQAFAITSPGGKAAVVGFTRGVYVVQVLMHGNDATPPIAGDLAQAQYDNLA